MPTHVTGRAAPFPLSNIDTDVIMPKRFLRTITREGLADGVLADLRFDTEGNENPDFILHRPPFRGAEILVVGDNFGCGSSREHAVWGLKQLGIKAIIGTSFAGIFYDNARKNLLVLASISPSARDAVLQAIAEQSLDVAIDLDQKQVRWDDQSVPITIDQATQRALVEEREDVSDTLSLNTQIREFEAKRPNKLVVRVPK